MKRVEFLKYLVSHDCVVAGEGGHHTYPRNLTNGKRTVIGRHRELDNKMARDICKQLDIPPMR